MILNSGNLILSEHYHCHQPTQHAEKRTQILSVSWNFHKHTATDLHVVLPLTLDILYACVKESTTGTRHICAKWKYLCTYTGPARDARVPQAD